MSENQYEQENGKDLRYNSEYLLHQLFLKFYILLEEKHEHQSCSQDIQPEKEEWCTQENSVWTCTLGTNAYTSIICICDRVVYWSKSTVYYAIRMRELKPYLLASKPLAAMWCGASFSTSLSFNFLKTGLLTVAVRFLWRLNKLRVSPKKDSTHIYRDSER